MPPITTKDLATKSPSFQSAQSVVSGHCVAMQHGKARVAFIPLGCFKTPLVPMVGPRPHTILCAGRSFAKLQPLTKALVPVLRPFRKMRRAALGLRVVVPIGKRPTATSLLGCVHLRYAPKDGGFCSIIQPTNASRAKPQTNTADLAHEPALFPNTLIAALGLCVADNLGRLLAAPTLTGSINPMLVQKTGRSSAMT